MSILLDTHSLVWWLEASSQLSSRAREAIDNARQQRFVSVVTAFEIATKVRIGKWDAARPIADQFVQICRDAQFDLLPLRVDHALKAGGLPGEHRDPFDRLLAAQAICDGLVFVTRQRLQKSWCGDALVAAATPPLRPFRSSGGPKGP